VPSIEARIIDPERGPVKKSRHTPDILNGAPFQDPARPDVTTFIVGFPVTIIEDGIDRPSAHEPSIKRHLPDAVTCRSDRTQSVQKIVRHKILLSSLKAYDR